MKTIVILAVSAMTFVSIAAEASQTDKTTDRAPTSHSTKSRKHLGGFIPRPIEGKAVRFANAQNLVSDEILSATAAEMSHSMRLNIAVSPLKSDTATPASLLDKDTAAVVIIKASGDSSSSAMIVAPEDAWAILDVSALAKDKPNSKLLSERIRKELWRTTSIMLGASDSTYQPCLLSPVHSLADLDALRAKQICPEPLGAIQANAEALGCGVPVYTSYRQACLEGWAPAPTNDIQRAIYEQIKAEQSEKPSNPIRILPGQKPQGK